MSVISSLAIWFVYAITLSFDLVKLQVEAYTWCDDANECSGTSISDTTSSIYCYGYQACYNSPSIYMNPTSTLYDLYCNGYYACYSSQMDVYDSDIHCNGYYACAYINSGSDSIAAYYTSAYIDCNGYYSCYQSTIVAGYELECWGPSSCSYTTVSAIERIEAFGYYSLRYATISSLSVSSNTLFIYMYGYGAGYGSTLRCYYSYHTCYLYCQGNACSGVTIDTAYTGTWIVYCDDSLGDDCPYNYDGPTPSPTDAPTDSPTGPPTGGNEVIYCRDDSECSYRSLVGTSVDCRGYYACYCGFGSGYSITATTGYVYCDGYQSCYGQDTITSYYSISCMGYYSCYDADMTSTYSDITCDSYYSCYSTTMTASGVYCRGYYSCGASTITDADYIYGYGMYSLQSTSIIQNSGTVNIYYYGYGAGSSSSVTCYSSALCRIYCSGTGCNNVNLYCYGSNNCDVSCDESEGIDCPNGYVGPTPIPTDYPTIEPTDRPTPRPTINPTTQPTAQPTALPSIEPSVGPSNHPTGSPTPIPTFKPTQNPTDPENISVASETTAQSGDSPNSPNNPNNGGTEQPVTTACDCSSEGSASGSESGGLTSSSNDDLSDLTKFDSSLSYVVIGLFVLVLLLLIGIVILCVDRRKLKKKNALLAGMSSDQVRIMPGLTGIAGNIRSVSSIQVPQSPVSMDGSEFGESPRSGADTFGAHGATTGTGSGAVRKVPKNSDDIDINEESMDGVDLQGIVRNRDGLPLPVATDHTHPHRVNVSVVENVNARDNYNAMRIRANYGENGRKRNSKPRPPPRPRKVNEGIARFNNNNSSLPGLPPDSNSIAMQGQGQVQSQGRTARDMRSKGGGGVVSQGGQVMVHVSSGGRSSGGGGGLPMLSNNGSDGIMPPLPPIGAPAMQMVQIKNGQQPIQRQLTDDGGAVAIAMRRADEDQVRLTGGEGEDQVQPRQRFATTDSADELYEGTKG